MTNLLDRIGQLERGEAAVEFAECRRCGGMIFRTVFPAAEDTTSWYHPTEDEDGKHVVRGCRAATYQPGVGWDDSIDRRWVAEPR